MEPNASFDIGALLILGKVIECRSLSRAAALLGLPKSTVSRKINKLEADLGVKLLRMNTRRLTVTDLGEKLYRHALNIHAEVTAVRAAIEDSKLEPQGTLRVAMPVFLGLDFASQIGGAFLERYPKARLELRLVERPLHPVSDGFDVVLGFGEQQDSTLIARKLFTVESLLCASSQYLEGLPALPQQPSQLEDLPFVISGHQRTPLRVVLTRGRRRVELTPPVRAQANSFQISRQYVLQGHGIGLLPKRVCAEDLIAGRLVPLLPEWQLEAADVYMLYPFQLSYSTLISAFFDTATEVIREGRVASTRLLAAAGLENY